MRLGKYFGVEIGNVDLRLAQDIINKYKLPYIMITDNGKTILIDLGQPDEDGYDVTARLWPPQ